MDTNSVQLDYPLSKAIAVSVGAEQFRCWRNAALAILLLPDLFTSGVYIEGWIVLPRETIIEICAHGWCTAFGKILDPSIVMIEEQEQAMYYFPGLELQRRQLESSLHGSTLPLVCNSHYGRDGMAHTRYKEAYENAWQKAQELAKEYQSPPAIRVNTRASGRGVTIIEEC